MLTAPLPVDDAETLKALRSFDRSGILRGHKNLQRAAQFLQSGTATISVPCYLDAFCKPISIAAEGNALRPISISELRLDHWHRGRVLRGFLCAPSFRFIRAAASVFEDGSGNAARVLVSSVVFPDFFTENEDKLLPQGAQVTILEPCLVESNIFCKGTCLWVANPASIHINRKVDDPNKEFDELGDEEFAKQNFVAAIELYSKSLQVLSSKQGLLRSLSSRAEAWLRLEHPHKALEDSEQALKLSSIHEKSILIKTRSLWKLQQYVLAEAFVKESWKATAGKDSVLLQRLCEEAEALREQSSSGTHDVSRFFNKGNESGVAEFVGPVRIEMTSDGKGRGVFLTRDVGRGDLLLVSNAAVRVRLRQEMKAKLDRGDSSELLAHLLQVCLGSPRTLQQVYSMAEALHDPASVFETEQRSPEVVEKEAPSMELFKPDWDLNAQQQQQQFDVVRIQNVLECSTEFVLSEDYSDEFVGFWTLPAFINHSCLPNVCMRKFGRAMFVFAARDLKCGDELLRSYGYAMRPLALRRSKSSFECRCARCCLEKRLEEPLAKVNETFMRLLKIRELDAAECKEYVQMAVEIERVLRSMQDSVSEAEKMWIRATYPAAYLAYHGCREGEDLEEDDEGRMPDADEMLRALHETAPGDIMTLAMMFRYRNGGSEEVGMKLLEQEICVTHGHLRPGFVKVIIKLLETGRIGATT